jgi:hypothetical protein
MTCIGPIFLKRPITSNISPLSAFVVPEIPGNVENQFLGTMGKDFQGEMLIPPSHRSFIF